MKSETRSYHPAQTRWVAGHISHLACPWGRGSCCAGRACDTSLELKLLRFWTIGGVFLCTLKSDRCISLIKWPGYLLPFHCKQGWVCGWLHCWQKHIMGVAVPTLSFHEQLKCLWLKKITHKPQELADLAAHYNFYSVSAKSSQGLHWKCGAGMYVKGSELRLLTKVHFKL